MYAVGSFRLSYGTHEFADKCRDNRKPRCSMFAQFPYLIVDAFYFAILMFQVCEGNEEETAVVCGTLLWAFRPG